MAITKALSFFITSTLLCTWFALLFTLFSGCATPAPDHGVVNPAAARTCPSLDWEACRKKAQQANQ